LGADALRSRVTVDLEIPQVLREKKSSGRRGRTRTCDPLLRRQVLYPTELRARVSFRTNLP
jgi:hypothetical protein